MSPTSTEVWTLSGNTILERRLHHFQPSLLEETMRHPITCGNCKLVDFVSVLDLSKSFMFYPHFMDIMLMRPWPACSLTFLSFWNGDELWQILARKQNLSDVSIYYSVIYEIYSHCSSFLHVLTLLDFWKMQWPSPPSVITILLDSFMGR